MRHQRTDLNSFIALDALLAERSVTRAAKRLHMTQSAMSGVLKRLREDFGDPLLLPLGRGMQLTPRAESLVQPVREILLRVDAALGLHPQFDPATSRRRFVIVASDYVSHVLLGDVLARIARHAPGVVFDVRPVVGAARQLEHGGIDFIITPAHLAFAAHPQEKLYEDTYHVIACSTNTQLRSRITEEQYRSAGHVVYQGDEGASPWFDQWYANQHGSTRRVEVVTHGFALIPRFVIGTRRIATVQTRLARQFAQALPIRLLKPPVETPRLTEVLQWHRYRDDDPGVQWVRAEIVAAAREMAKAR
jgi:DNA-binding transcriptional LysR family regulator